MSSENAVDKHGPALSATYFQRIHAEIISDGRVFTIAGSEYTRDSHENSCVRTDFPIHDGFLPETEKV